MNKYIYQVIISTIKTITLINETPDPPVMASAKKSRDCKLNLFLYNINLKVIQPKTVLNIIKVEVIRINYLAQGYTCGP